MAEVYFRIVAVNKKENSFIVRYFTDECSEDDLATSFDEKGRINRDYDGYPLSCSTDLRITSFSKNASKFYIDSLIKGGIPHEWLKLKKHLKNNEVDMSYVDTLLDNIHNIEKL
jgi:hypothetical protein